MQCKAITISLLSLAMSLLFAAPACAKHGWSMAGDLLVAVNSGNAFALSDGRVVSVGLPDPKGVWPATTQIWSLKTNIWTATSSMPPLPHLYRALPVMLDDGRILVTGYCDRKCGHGANTEVYDPATDSWATPGPMQTGRYLHVAVRLLDGRVLVMGGCTNDNCSFKTNSAELFDPKTGQFTPAAPMHARRVEFSATLLADGRVLVTGGENMTGVLTENETYDPATGGWTVNAPMHNAHESHLAVAMPDGRVLVAGGACVDERPCKAAETFDPATGTWMEVAHLQVPREYPAGVVLQDGTVLVAGGLSCWGTLWRYMETAERFDPATNTFIHARRMHEQRGDFSMAMLRDGRVLAVGGDAWVNGDEKIAGDAELYKP
jgi:hypothetical protein